MTRMFYLVALFLSLTIKLTGQCPSLMLSSSGGGTCGINPITISGNIFVNATRVTLHENGAGSLSQDTESISPFSFTYTPGGNDIGKTITITVTTNNPPGFCHAAEATFLLDVNPQPSSPVVQITNNPTCQLPTATILVSGLPGDGTWTLTQIQGNLLTSGSGSGTTLRNIPSGTYNFTVTNSFGCISPLSAAVLIPSPPAVPAAPLIGSVTQPLYQSPTGSVVVNGLPASGTWTLNLTPGNVKSTGTGTSVTINGLASGVYNFTVTNSSGCTSGLSANFEINAVSGPPVVKISSHLPVCYPSTVDLTAPSITAGSTPNLTYSYWTDANATIPMTTPTAATTGTYYIKGTTSDGFSTIQPVVVTVFNRPVANGGPDQTLTYIFNTNMHATLAHNYESGKWSLFSGIGQLSDNTNASTTVNGLSLGKNIFVWTVTNAVCPASSDTVIIYVRDFVVPTLITPNNDGKNDFLILKRSDVTDKIDLIIFDRRGLQVYKNGNYDNSWDGIDQKGNQLPDDTYFYVTRSSKGSTSNGFVVIRRLK